MIRSGFQGEPNTTYAPWRALSHPFWWCALAVLLINDHVLKGAGILPSALTGKLSDLAGLVVAPWLLAVLCQATSRRALALAHVVVGVGFALIQLSPAASAATCVIVGMAGIPWTLWPDPTDVLALPMLAIAWHVLAPHARSTTAAVLVAPWRRTLAVAGVGLGALSSVATAALPAPHATVPGHPDQMKGDVYLVNDTTYPLGVHVSLLSERADFACELVAQDVGARLHPTMFTREGVWTQQPGESTAIWPLRMRSEAVEARGCYAVKLEIEDAETVYVFWMADDVEVQVLPKFPTKEEIGAGAVVVGNNAEALSLCHHGPVTLARMGD